MIDYIIPQRLVERAYYADWHKKSGRGAMYTRTDLDKAHRTDRKVLAGNIAEAAAYGAYCGKYGIPCDFPNFGETDRPGKSIWPDDLVFQDKWKLGRYNLLQSHSVKGQFYTEAKKWHPSWIFQLDNKTQSRFRHGDPMLKDPSMPCLFMGVLIDDKLFDAFPNVPVSCKIYTFFWPRISEHIAEPAVDHHKGSKKAMYLRDINLLEIDHAALQRQPKSE